MGTTVPSPIRVAPPGDASVLRVSCVISMTSASAIRPMENGDACQSVAETMAVERSRYVAAASDGAFGDTSRGGCGCATHDARSWPTGPVLWLVVVLIGAWRQRRAYARGTRL